MTTLGGFLEAGGSQNDLKVNDLACFAVDEHNKKQVTPFGSMGVPAFKSKVSMEKGGASPVSYLLKVESFSFLSSNDIDKYESSEFECSGYKWKMIIYPNGDVDVSGHISIYLAIVAGNSLDVALDVNAIFSFLILDQIQGNFVIVKGMEKRFRKVKSEWGFSDFISLEAFKDPSNGYLVKDKCVFGVDVQVIKNQGVGELLSSLNSTQSYEHEWKITEFSKLDTSVSSDVFTVGGYKWKLQLFPKGDTSQNGKSISIFLTLVDAKGFDSRKKVFAKRSSSIKDQISDAHCKSTSASRWYSAKASSWGWSAFMPLSKFMDPTKGFLVNDCCIVVADVSVLGVVTALT